jgi:hypothetical protein
MAHAPLLALFALLRGGLVRLRRRGRGTIGVAGKEEAAEIAHVRFGAGGVPEMASMNIGKAKEAQRDESSGKALEQVVDEANV